MQHHKLNISVHNQPAHLTTYLLDNFEEIDPNRRQPLVVICPGGGYACICQRETEAVAIRLNAMGFHAVILTYSTAPVRFPIALAQLATVIAMVRQNAERWHVNPDQISVMGFSAGGHLAGSLGVFWNSPLLQDALPEYSSKEIRPDRLVLCYPVITAFEYRHDGSFRDLLGNDYGDMAARNLVSLENQVSKDTPPTFLWHTATDTSVPPQNSLLFASALLRHHVPCELHLYPQGRHGLSLANSVICGPDLQEMIVPACQNWIDMAGRFLLTEL